MRGTFAVTLVSTDPTAGIAAVPGVPNQQLLQPSQLMYQGAFRLPPGPTGSSFADAGSAIAFNAAGQSLFVGSPASYQMVGEFSVPAIRVSTVLTDLATAGVIQPFADPTDGALPSVNDNGTTNKVGGALVYGNQLLVTSFSLFNNVNSHVSSQFISSLNLSLSGDVEGPLAVSSATPGYLDGYFTSVPLAWQAALGGPVLNGNCCDSPANISVHGPSMFSLDLATIDSVDRTPTTPLMYYPQTSPTPNGSSGQTLFDAATEIKGLVFPEGTRTVLFFGRRGEGTPCDGLGTADPNLAGTAAPQGGLYCYDPLTSARRTHAYPYVYYVWAYDAADLAAVKSGAKKPWEVSAYQTWRLDLPFRGVSAELQGVTYDRQTGRIFVSQAHGDGSRPIVYVLSVQP